MQEKMDVRVNEARKQSGVAEVDEVRLVRVRHQGADFHDEVATHQDFPGRQRAARFDVEEPSGVEHDGARRRPRFWLVCLPVNWWNEEQRAAESKYCECSETAMGNHVNAR